jgi:hypothetical protein
MNSHSILFAALLLAVPVTGALAQSSNLADTSGSDRLRIAMPGRANDHNRPETNAWKSATEPGISAAAEDPNVPGATGRTIVAGSHSTIAGDSNATEGQRITGDSSGG